MHRITIVIALTILLLASFGTAQQTTNDNSTTAQQTGSPTPPPGPIIGGMGTANYIPIWATPNFLLSSVIYQDSTGKVGIATTTPMVKLDVHGAINTADTYRIGNSTVLSIGSAGDQNLFVGVGAGDLDVGGMGQDNVFMGYFAGTGNTTGFFNTFIGSEAGQSNTTGQANTFVGSGAGANSTGSSFSNTFIGYGAGSNNNTGSNDIYLANYGPSSGTESGAIRIGDPSSQTATWVAGIYGSTSSGGIPVYINSNGRLGTTTSSLRFKEHVRDMGDSTGALMKLRPVTFRYKPEYADGERTLQYGLIAEEVAKVYPELVAYDKDGQPYSVRYQYLSTMLLNEVQKQYRRAEEQSKVIETQQREIESLKQLQLQNATLQERVSRLEKLLETQTVAQK
jgi:hypothetical protein